MSHTNSTANLSLPQFIGTDKPTWLSDVNGAFAAIDSYAGSNDAALAIVDGKADTAIGDASSAVTTATNAATTAGNAAATATNANTIAGNALTVANGINSKVGVLTDLHTTDKSSVVNAINEVKDAEGDLTSLVTTDKSSLVAAINEAAGGGSSNLRYDDVNGTIEANINGTWTVIMSNVYPSFSAKMTVAHYIGSSNIRVSYYNVTVSNSEAVVVSLISTESITSGSNPSRTDCGLDNAPINNPGEISATVTNGAKYLFDLNIPISTNTEAAIQSAVFPLDVSAALTGTGAVVTSGTPAATYGATLIAYVAA